MDEEKQNTGGIRNLWLSVIIIVSVLAVLFVLGPILEGTVVNDFNRIYDEYYNISSIKVDYVAETITIDMYPMDWFDTADNHVTYDLNKVYKSPLFEIDNTVDCPTLVDGVVHIPDTYPR